MHQKTLGEYKLDHSLSSTTIWLRGRDVEVLYRMAPAEPDVGFPTDYVDYFDLFDPHTEERLDWDLFKHEEDQVIDACYANHSRQETQET